MYLPLSTLVLYCNGLMIFVLCLGAELAHALLFVPAEHLQQPLVLLAQSVLQVLHRRDQLVQLQGGHSLVRLQVGFTVRGQTDQAGLQGLHLHGRGSTDITQHLPCLGCRQRWDRWTDYYFLECVCQLFKCCVDAYFRPGAEWLFTGGALADFINIPQILDAGLAEVVSAGSGDWVGEHLLTDGALELLFW